MTNDEGNPKSEIRRASAMDIGSGFRASSFFRRSALGIRHSDHKTANARSVPQSIGVRVSRPTAGTAMKGWRFEFFWALVFGAWFFFGHLNLVIRHSKKAAHPSIRVRDSSVSPGRAH